MLSDYSTLLNAYGSCYSLSENYIEDFKDDFGGYSSLGVRTTGGNFSGLRSFSAPAPYRSGTRHPSPHRLPYHNIPTHTFPNWYGLFYRNYYYPYFYNRYNANRFTFFDSLNDVKNKYPTLPSESDKNIMKDFIINLPTIVPCDLPCRDYVKFFIETYLTVEFSRMGHL